MSKVRPSTQLAQDGASLNYVLTWDGTKWTGAATGTPSGGAGGDLTGIYPNPTLDLTKTHVWTAEQAAPDWKVTGLTGATTAGRYVGGTATGAPTTGTFAVNDWITTADGHIWICTTAGTPGTWVNAGTGSGMTDPTTTKGDLIVHGTSTTRLPVGANGQVLTANSAATNGVDWEPAGALAAPVVKIRTAGNLSISNSAFAAVDTALDITLAAVTGDLIEVGLSTFWDPPTTAIFSALDVVTLVSGSIVTYLGTGTSTPGNGIGSWFAGSQGLTGSDDFRPAASSFLYALAAGDISGGNVVLRLVVKSGARSLRANTTDRLEFWARNLKQ